MSNMTELKPCPFCGMELDDTDSDTLHISGGWIEHPIIGRHYVPSREAPPDQKCYAIHCNVIYGGCGASISGDSRQEAINNWNRRV